MRIAYFSPLNPIESGISDYSEELLPYLAQYAEIDLFIDDNYRPSNPKIVKNFRVYNYRDFDQLRAKRAYDVNLYHIGNSPYHEYIYRTLLRYPGVVVLHDYVLHHLFIRMTLAKGDARGYIEEMRYCYGEMGAALAREVVSRKRQVDPFEYPLTNRVLDASLAVIVHSNYMKDLVEGIGPRTKAAKVNSHLNLGMLYPDSLNLSETRADLGLNDDQFIVASFGLITPQKRINVSLQAFARFRQYFPSSVFVLVGGVLPSYNLEEVIHKVNLEKAVIATGRTDLDTFLRYMAIADLGVNLRFPTAGETSASLIRLMGMGKPVIVSNVGSFAEFPDDCCAKVDVDEYEEALLFEYMKFLAANEAVRRQMGENARRYVEENHTLEGSAKAYVEVIEQVLSQSHSHYRIDPLSTDIGDVLLEEIAEEMAGLGICDDDETILEEIAQAIADLNITA
jgi:glycosyltransferase involved in cell wall biosynthesis